MPLLSCDEQQCFHANNMFPRERKSLEGDKRLEMLWNDLSTCVGNIPEFPLRAGATCQRRNMAGGNSFRPRSFTEAQTVFIKANWSFKQKQLG